MNRSKRLHRARNRKRAGVVGAAVAVALLLASLVLVLDRGAPPSAPVAVAMRTAAPSPAPKPWTRAQVGRLRAALAAAFAPALAGAGRWSLCVMAPDGRVLFSDRAHVGVTPASVQKLVMASSALDLLGAEFRYDTLIVASQPIAAGGTLAGNLWLVGSGDPSLRNTDVAAAVQALARGGLRRIEGGVLVDASAFRGPEINPLWNPADANEGYQAATSAISLDEDTVEFDVYGTMPGAPAVIRMIPWSGAVSAIGGIATVGASDDPNVIVAALVTPNHFDLSGTITAGEIDKEYVPVHDIAHYAGVVMTQLLRERGIVAFRGPGVGVVPLTKVVLWEHRSAPLHALERHMLYLSDNHYAEQLLRTLGLVVDGRGDDAHGLAVERADLRRRGIPTTGMRLVDGSGLAHANRLSALTIATILARALRLPQERGFYDLLPQGGRSGTVKGYDFTTALGRVRAKTGHLTGASSLAGYVVSRHHGSVAFAFMIDASPGDPDGAMVHAVDRISEF